MRTRFRYDADLDAVVEIRNNYFEETAPGPAVISDDVGAGVNGLRHMPSGMMLDSKSRHRAETKARGLIELGSDVIPPQPDRPTNYGQEVKDASDQIAGNYNGTADRLARDRERAPARPDLIHEFMRRS